MLLPFESAAADEFEEAASFIDSERPGHGERFVEEVLLAIDQATVFPRSGRQVPESPDDNDVRIFGLRRFPYSLVTAIISERRTIVAIAHDRRAPGYWLSRVK